MISQGTCSSSHHFQTSEQTRPEPKDDSPTHDLNFMHLDTQNWRGHIVWLAISQANHSSRSGQQSIIRASSLSDNASLLSVSVATSVSRSPRGRFVSMVAVSVTTSSFTTASPCPRFAVTMNCFFAASRDAWWKLAGSASFNFFKSIVSSKLVWISITWTLRAGYIERVMATATVDSRLFEFQSLVTFGADVETLGDFCEKRAWLLPPLTRACLISSPRWHSELSAEITLPQEHLRPSHKNTDTVKVVCPHAISPHKITVVTDPEVETTLPGSPRDSPVGQAISHPHLN